jgi:hypothetical protein
MDCPGAGSDTATDDRERRRRFTVARTDGDADLRKELHNVRHRLMDLGHDALELVGA